MSTTVRPAVLIFAVGALAFSLGYLAFPHSEDDHFAGGTSDLSGLTLDPGTTAPAFVVDNLDGSPLASSDLEGKIVVIDFWATWCAPCLTEIPHYNSLHEEYADKGVEMLGMTLQSGSQEQVVEWISRPVRVGTQEFSLDYPVVMGNADVEASWGPIYGFPMTYLVDSEWKIRKKWLGAVANKSEQLRYLIDELIAERDDASS